MRTLLRWIARRCDVHDVPLPPLRIAAMEEATGVRPGAVAELRATTEAVLSHCNPGLIDCGRHWCRKRRGLA